MSPPASKIFTLTGVSHACYQAGEQMGMSHGYAVAADNLRRLDGFDELAKQFQEESDKCKTKGSRLMAKVATCNRAEENRWKPPLRAWGMLVLAMMISTTVATLASKWLQ